MHIAWIGNSYVYYHDLPLMLAGLLAAGGVSSSSGQVSPGGQRLAQHAADPSVAALLEQPWDVAVLQDNSAVPGGADSGDRAASESALRDFFAPRLAGRRVLLYGTWGHAAGCAYARLRARYPDYATMQRLTTAGCEGYTQLLRAAGAEAELAPVGDAFELVHREEVEAGRDPLSPASLFRRLYAPDDLHPSRLGSYLAACVFFAALTGAHVEDSAAASRFRPSEAEHDRKMREKHGWEPGELDDAAAARLQSAAKAAVEARAARAGAAGEAPPSTSEGSALRTEL